MNLKNLVGKTIESACFMKYDEYDDKAWLKLAFTDGTECLIISKYSETYTGKSLDEYRRNIDITDKIDNQLKLITEE